MGEAVQRVAAGPGTRALTLTLLKTPLMTGVSTAAGVVTTQRTRVLFIQLFTQRVLVKVALRRAARGKGQTHISCTLLPMFSNDFQISCILSISPFIIVSLNILTHADKQILFLCEKKMLTKISDRLQKHHKTMDKTGNNA